MFIFSRSMKNSTIETIEIGKLNWLQLHLVTTHANAELLDNKLLKDKNINTLSLSNLNFPTFFAQYGKYLTNLNIELGPKMTTSLITNRTAFFDSFILVVRTGDFNKKQVCGNISTLKTLINTYKLVHTSPLYRYLDSEWCFYVFEPYTKHDLLIK